jgi:hypothetical protein
VPVLKNVKKESTSMLKIRIAVAVFLTVTIYSSCCKVYCPRELMSMRFIGFDPSDIDTLIIRKYEPTNFTTPIDTFMRIGIFSPMDTVYFDYFDSDGFQFSKNYDVSLPGIGRSFRINELKTRREECNCGQKDGKRVARYTLDGQTFTEQVVYMRK